MGEISPLSHPPTLPSNIKESHNENVLKYYILLIKNSKEILSVSYIISYMRTFIYKSLVIQIDKKYWIFSEKETRVHLNDWRCGYIRVAA